MTSFTGLTKKRDTNVLKTVLGDQPLAKLGGAPTHPTCNVGIDGPTGKERFRDRMHVVDGGGDSVGVHNAIVN